MKKILIFILVFNLLYPSAVLAMPDISKSEESRKHFIPPAMGQEAPLPALPKNLQSISDEDFGPPVSVKRVNVSKPQNQAKPKPVSLPAVQTSKKTVSSSKSLNKQVEAKPAVVKNAAVKNNTSGFAVLKRGTKFQTKLLTGVNDRMNRGTAVLFSLRYPVTTTYLTLPVGTIIKGRLKNAHTPQLGGNGGLISLRLTSIEVNGREYQAEGFVTEANYKIIFFNNIKGQRKFAKSMFGSMKPGVSFYKKMMTASARLLNDDWNAIWSPFPFVAGFGALLVTVAASPLCASFSKGSEIYLPSGSLIDLKLEQDLIIQN